MSEDYELQNMPVGEREHFWTNWLVNSGLPKWAIIGQDDDEEGGFGNNNGGDEEVSPPAGIYEDFFYGTTETNSIIIFRYEGDGGDVEIPAQIYGKPVTDIGDFAFNECENLISITIPDSVTSIGKGAFWWGCSSLTSVTFQGTITSENFHDAAFEGDLKEKFYETDPINGTPGTYTRPDSSSDEWVRW